MSTNTKSKLSSALALLGGVALCTACGSDGDSPDPNSSAGTSGTPGTAGTAGTAGMAGTAGLAGTAGTAGDASTTRCPDFQGEAVAGPGPGSGCEASSCFSCITPVEGMSFGGGMFSITDKSGVTTADLRTEPKSACMSGTNVGFASLLLTLGSRSVPLNAPALGITQVRFTIDHPPSTGVIPGFAIRLHDGSAAGLSLMAGDKAVAVVSTQTLTSELSEFRSPDVVFDQSQLTAITFGVGLADPYDFCIRDLKFLDANDEEVLPPP